MNKLWTEVLKAYQKDREDNTHMVTLYEYDGSTLAVLFDKFRIFLVPREDFVFDEVRVTRGRGVAAKSCLSWIWEEEKDAKSAALTDKWKSFKSGTVRLIENKNTHAWVDEKFIKMYEKGAKFKILGRKKPVFIYEEGHLVSMVLPVNMAEDREKEEV